MKLDLLLTNARIVTVDRARPTASSIGIWNGHIVGLDNEVTAMPAEAVVDLGGAAVTPGFHDGHCHTTSFGLGLVSLALNEISGIAQTLDAVADYAATLGDDEWVIGFGYGAGLAPDQYPHADELDRAGGGRPVWLTHLSGHSCIVSNAVLAAVGIDGALSEGERGQVVVDEQGRPTGLLEEIAMDRVKQYVGPSSIEQMAQAIDRATAHYLTEGITGFTDAGIGCPGIDHTPIEMAAYQLARATGRLHTRAQLMAFNDLFHEVMAHPDDTITHGLDLGIRSGLGDPWLNVGAMKIWVDGSGLGHSAAVTGRDGKVRGGFDNDPELLRRSIVAAVRGGWQVASHCIGDGAVDLVLDAIEEGMHTAVPALGGTLARHRIEHGVMIRPDQITRMASMGVSVVLQPLFLPDFGDPLLQLFPDGRGSENYFRMRSLVDAGVLVVGSSDRPVSEGSPLKGMQSMVERITLEGAIFGEDERLTATEALTFYTDHGARAATSEHLWGRLRPRMLADLVVLSDDPTTAPTDRIGEIDVLATVIGGQALYDPEAMFGRVRDDAPVSTSGRHAGSA